MTPVVSAVWSCDPTTALAYPARYLFTFLGHHGLLGVKGSPQWRTVTGGSRSYVDKVAGTLPDIRLSSPVTAVQRHADGVDVTSARGTETVTETFDAVVIATHPAQALRMLADASAAEKDALGGMPYSVNQTIFHRDAAVLPASPNAQASWNYRLPSCDARPDKVLVSYDMTRLQRLEPVDGGRYIVSLGESELIDHATVLDRMVYEHPQYTPDSLKAQERILGLGDERLAFAGAYHGWGFHEDGALSGLKAAARLGRDWDQLPVNIGAVNMVPWPWTRTSSRPRRRHERAGTPSTPPPSTALPLTRQPSTAPPSPTCGAPRCTTPSPTAATAGMSTSTTSRSCRACSGRWPASGWRTTSATRTAPCAATWKPTSRPREYGSTADASRCSPAPGCSGTCSTR